nr:RNA-directed DNA polymerase, eukaryota, reverse transcriptase zinc-binding domain protein [Tanacetum cinerariifolium]
MLCNINFGLTWRSWIKAFLESSRTSILINDSLTFEFNVKRAYLSFADDVIITTDWSMHDLDNVICAFQIMAANTGCSAGLFPFTYLGLPIGFNMSLISNWNALVDKFHLKLSFWKANLLSYGGRLMLIKAVLGSLGGLAIGSLNSFSLTLLHKWRWRFFSSPDSLWVNVIKALHGSEGGFDLFGCKFNDT